MVFLIAISSLILFSLIDYFGFTYAIYNDKVKTYRIYQGILQIFISIICIYAGNLEAAIIFNLLWWTWCADWLFYFYCFVFNYKGNRKDSLQPFRQDVRWAFWTPYGILQLLIKGKEKVYYNTREYTLHFRKIKPIILIIQSIIGIVVSLFIFLT